MLSSLQALNAAGAAPASRAATFQPKVKPRARRGGRAPENETGADENSEPVQDSAPVAETATPAAPAAAPAPVSVSPVDTTGYGRGPGAPPDASSQAVPNITKRLDFSTPPSGHSTPSTPLPAGHSVTPSSSTRGNSAPPSSAQRHRLGKQTLQFPVSSNTPSSSSPETAQQTSPETGESSKGKKRRVSNSSAPRKKRVENLDEAIDPAKMTMKDIIRLAEAKERKKQKEEASKKQETQASAGSSAGREREPVVPLAPQVEIVNGKIVINQQSLEIDARALNKDDVGTYRRIEESSSKLNYHSYMKPIPRERWKPEETELFYKAVQQFGTDFAVIQRLFPERQRQQIKNKYKKEERENPRRLSELILQPRKDLTHYEDLVNRLRASAEAAKAADDEYAFTWDVNTNRTNEEGEGVEENGANEDENDAGGNGSVVDPNTYEEIDDPAYGSVAEENSPKKEESPRAEIERPSSTMEAQKKEEETSIPPLFAFEMETSDFPLSSYS